MAAERRGEPAALAPHAGERAFANIGYQLDGIDNHDTILRLIVVNPPPESITESKSTSQNYNAEFAQALAGLVSVQTKSGSNELHGSACEFLQRDTFQGHPRGNACRPRRWPSSSSSPRPNAPGTANGTRDNYVASGATTTRTVIRFGFQDLAEAELRQAVAKDARLPMAHYLNPGNEAHVRQGRYPHAVDALQKALSGSTRSAAPPTSCWGKALPGSPDDGGALVHAGGPRSAEAGAAFTQRGRPR